MILLSLIHMNVQILFRNIHRGIISHEGGILCKSSMSLYRMRIALIVILRIIQWTNNIQESRLYHREEPAAN